MKTAVIQRRVQTAVQRRVIRPARPFASATTAGSAGGGHDFARISVSAPIQRVLNVDQARVAKGLRNSLQHSLKQFNDYGDRNRNTKTALHAQFAMLDRIQRQVNRHLRDNSASIGDDERGELFSLLNQTQQHHVGLTARNVQHGHDLWLRPGLTRSEQNQRQKLWRSLIGGKGNVKLATQNDQFRNQTHSDFAQLLQGSHGAGLLADLNRGGRDAGKHVVISDDHSVDQSATYPQHRRDADPGSWAQNFPGARGAGGANVQVSDTAPPASLGEYQSDLAGKALFEPHFITLGHELGHARHILKGTLKGQEWSPDDAALRRQPREREFWTNPEEHANITGEENPIRAENDLPRRRYHGTIDATRARGHRYDLNRRLDDLYATIPGEHQRAVGRHVREASEAVHRADLARPDQVTAVTARVDQLQRDLPGRVRNERIKSYVRSAGASVKSALTPTVPKALGLAGGALGLWLWSQRGQE